MSLDLPAIEALLQAANGSLVGRDYIWATTMLLTRFTELDPVDAIRQIEASSYHQKRYWFQKAFATYGFMNIEAALLQASKLPVSRRRDAHASILSGIEHLDYAERKKYADQTGVNLAIDLSGRDPRLVWQQALAIEDEKQRTKSLRALANAIAHTEARLALELAADLAVSAGQDDAYLVEGILRQWTKTDAKGALSWLQSRPEELKDTKQQLTILSSLASQDVVLGVQAIELFPIEEISGAIGAVGYEWAQQDATSAMQWLSKLNLKNDSLDGYANAIGHALGNQSLSFIETWQDEIPEEISTTALFQALRTEVEVNPANAMEIVEKQSQARTRGSLAKAVIYNLSQKDPVVAADWIESLELEPTDRSALYKGLFSTMVFHDSDAAYAFALDMETPALRDDALVALSSTRQVSTQRIEEIYELIEQPIQKMQIASVLHKRIAAEDPARAAELRSNGWLSPLGGMDGDVLQGCLADALDSR